METIVALFNMVLIVFIVTTMLSAGFNTTLAQIGAAVSRVGLLVAVLVVAFVIRPLAGWATAEIFGLATGAYIATVLLWSCPGAPFGAKLVMTAKADLQSGAVLQVLMASLGSLTFAPTANLIIGAADLGDDVSLPVGQLIATVAVLQLVPFCLGILIRHRAEDQAKEWGAWAQKVSGLTFVIVLTGALLGSWQTIIDLVGSLVLIAATVTSAVMIGIGYLISVGDTPTKKAAALIQPCTNSGPALAAVGIAFDNDPEILGAITGILLIQIVVGLVVASLMAKKQAPEPAAA
ncbi:bile acid:sodium symporter family protein [Nocardioides sambongensis]|uniref:bile acid:sodium symporter family protein n=1 Tax=Nocardioides sambongensis TaxID=2589074 RepID=UPI00112A1BF4|nr:bile acid:sodium symporter [Nocardioides sambongensis]